VRSFVSRPTSWKIARPWLTPLVPLYAAGAALRSAGFRLGLERVERLAWPVISVGSLSAGGAGKTPLVIALTKLLREAGLGVDVLSRGYGRRTSTAARVDPQGDAPEFGDEPLLIAQEAPVYVAARRIQAGRLAEASGTLPGLHLLDDGFQHRQLARDVDVVLVSSDDLKDWLLPAGSLREGLGALRRAHLLAIDADDDTAFKELRVRGLSQPVWRFRRRMTVPAVEGPVVAFCGIARPAQFFTGLETAGMRVVGRHAFPDHHAFIAQDFTSLRLLARQVGGVALVTTAKDSVRLGDGEREIGLPVHIAGLEIQLEDEAGIVAGLRKMLAGRLG
jgi:tetraacyldisaccharide 4'-kinase